MSAVWTYFNLDSKSEQQTLVMCACWVFDKDRATLCVFVFRFRHHQSKSLSPLSPSFPIIVSVHCSSSDKSTEPAGSERYAKKQRETADRLQNVGVSQSPAAPEPPTKVTGVVQGDVSLLAATLHAYPIKGLCITQFSCTLRA
uniref:Uncharacterized protein n=1 Tax=Nothobranchius furzeri TaxID=105023 RepID=A0A1A8UY51_NOTFU